MLGHTVIDSACHYMRWESTCLKARVSPVRDYL